MTYLTRISEMANTNPVSECDRVLEILKDYFIERKYMLEHVNEICGVKDMILDEFNPSKMILAGKEYFEDYIYKNEIDINSIRDEEERKKVFEFVRNPVVALYKKYPNENLFVDKKNESYEEFYNQYKRDWDRKNSKVYKLFKNNFNLNNNKPRGSNVGKSISRIMEDNKGGWFERHFDKTSKQYKALVSSMNETMNKNSASYGDLKGIEFYAKKYIDYKIPRGFDERRLSSTAKKRVEFCRTILKAVQATKDELEAPKVQNNNPENNNEFQNQLKEEIQEKEIIEIKEDNDIIEVKESEKIIENNENSVEKV